MRNVTFRQLQIFVAAAETLSFARAAESSCTCRRPASRFRSSRSRSMRDFRCSSGSAGRRALTEAGKALLGYAKHVLQALHDAEQAMTALQGLAGGAVTIGLVSTAKYLVPHMLARFQADYPRVAIHLLERQPPGDQRRPAARRGRPRGDGAAVAAAADIVAEPFAPHPSVIVAAAVASPGGIAPPAGSVARRRAV